MSNENDFTFKQITELDKSYKRGIHTPLIHIDMAGDLNAGILLSQILYWYDGRLGGSCLVKQRSEWYDEIRLSPTQYDLAIKKLIEKGLVSVQIRKSQFHNGTRAAHITLNVEVFTSLFNEVLTAESESQQTTKLRKHEFANSGNMNNQIHETSISTITELTNIDYSNSKESVTQEHKNLGEIQNTEFAAGQLRHYLNTSISGLHFTQNKKVDTFLNDFYNKYSDFGYIAEVIKHTITNAKTKNLNSPVGFIISSNIDDLVTEFEQSKSTQLQQHSLFTDSDIYKQQQAEIQRYNSLTAAQQKAEDDERHAQFDKMKAMFEQEQEQEREIV